jgi:hypothetical protein
MTIDLSQVIGWLASACAAGAMLWIQRLTRRVEQLEETRTDVAVIKSRIEHIDGAIGELHVKVDRLAERP